MPAKVSVAWIFAGKILHISYVNLSRNEYGSYGVFAASCGSTALPITDGTQITIPRAILEQAEETDLSIVLHIK